MLRKHLPHRQRFYYIQHYSVKWNFKRIQDIQVCVNVMLSLSTSNNNNKKASSVKKSISSKALIYFFLMLWFPSRQAQCQQSLPTFCCCCWNCVNMLYLIDTLFRGNIELKCFVENYSSASIHCTHHSEDVPTYILGFITHSTLVSLVL